MITGNVEQFTFSCAGGAASRIAQPARVCSGLFSGGEVFCYVSKGLGFLSKDARKKADCGFHSRLCGSCIGEEAESVEQFQRMDAIFDKKRSFFDELGFVFFFGR